MPAEYAAAVILPTRIRTGLAEAGCPANAAPMQAYLKSAMPCHGLRMSDLRRIVRPMLGADPITDRADWEQAVRTLWDDAAFREERYAAIEVAGYRTYRPWQDADTMPLYEHLVRAGAWWDLADPVASSLVGPILLDSPGTEGERMHAWANADDLWLRRTAIIAQLKAGDRTDTDLLTQVIRANLEGTRYGSEFFIRKAIGWALRQYARTDPDWVRTFVATHAAGLSALSRREAVKHL